MDASLSLHRAQHAPWQTHKSNSRSRHTAWSICARRTGSVQRQTAPTLRSITLHVGCVEERPADGHVACWWMHGGQHGGQHAPSCHCPPSSTSTATLKRWLVAEPLLQDAVAVGPWSSGRRPPTAAPRSVFPGTARVQLARNWTVPLS